MKNKKKLDFHAKMVIIMFISVGVILFIFSFYNVHRDSTVLNDQEWKEAVGVAMQQSSEVMREKEAICKSKNMSYQIGGTDPFQPIVYCLKISSDKIIEQKCEVVPFVFPESHSRAENYVLECE